MAAAAGRGEKAVVVDIRPRRPEPRGDQEDDELRRPRQGGGPSSPLPDKWRSHPLAPACLPACLPLLSTRDPKQGPVYDPLAGMMRPTSLYKWSASEWMRMGVRRRLCDRDCLLMTQVPSSEQRASER